MSSLNLHDSMIQRAAVVVDEADPDADPHETARRALEAAFDGVPLTNYSIGTLLGDFDLVIAVKEFPTRAAAFVARRESGRPPSEGFETTGHTLTAHWGDKPSRYLKSVTVGKIDPPAAP
jgi:hypothetical protein